MVSASVKIVRKNKSVRVAAFKLIHMQFWSGPMRIDALVHAQVKADKIGFTIQRYSGAEKDKSYTHNTQQTTHTCMHAHQGKPCWILWLAGFFLYDKAKPTRAKLSQAKQSQAKQSQTKPSKAK